MKKILIIIATVLVFFSCKKEKDVTNEDFTVTASVALWDISEQAYVQAPDSFKFQFYNSHTDASPFAIVYSDSEGKSSVVLKGDRMYYMKCIAPAGNFYDDETDGMFNSTRLAKGNKKVAGDFSALFMRE